MKKILLFIFSFVYLSVYAQDGSLDNTFGIGGKVTTDFGSSTDEGKSVAIQSDGKIVVAGNSWNGSGDDFSLVRYNSDGSLDNTFGSGGKVTTDFGGALDFGTSIAIQNDGKIVVAGWSWTYPVPNVTDFALVRYNSNGSLDTTFGTNGKVITDFGGPSDVGTSVTIQSDGRIVVAGGSKQGTYSDFALARYNSDGSLDGTFGTGGKVLTDFGSPSESGYSVIMQNDGKIVVAGKDYDGFNYDPGHDFVLARYKNNGTLDSTFGSGGKVTTDLGSNDDYGFSAAIQSDGKIVVAGHSYLAYNGDFALVRYNSDGTLDSTFNTDGKVFTDFGGSGECGYSVAIQTDGKIVVAGVKGNVYPNDDFALARYNSDGTLDNTFGSGGKVTTDFGGNTIDKSYSVAIQGDGKIVVVGYSGNSSNHDFAVARYNSGTVGIEENMQMSDVNIYPNPSSGIFTVDLGNCKDAKLSVCDVLGNRVWKKDYGGETSQEINLSFQPKGIYFLEIVSDGERFVKKIILE